MTEEKSHALRGVYRSVEAAIEAYQLRDCEFSESVDGLPSQLRPHVEKMTQWFNVLKAGHADYSNLDSAYYYAWCLFHGWGTEISEENDTEAFEIAQALAVQGDPRGRYLMGLSYLYGKGAPYQDAVKGIENLTSAMAYGSADAAYQIAFYGLTSDIDREKLSLDLLFKFAAKRGHVQAMAELGLLYWQGFEALQSDVEASLWFKKAAKKGHIPSIYHIGEMYLTGQGLRRSFPKALDCLLTAKRNGEEFASKRIDDLRNQFLDASLMPNDAKNPEHVLLAAYMQIENHDAGHRLSDITALMELFLTISEDVWKQIYHFNQRSQGATVSLHPIMETILAMDLLIKDAKRIVGEGWVPPRGPTFVAADLQEPEVT